MRIATLALLGSLMLGTRASAQVQEHSALWGGFGLGAGLDGNEGNTWGVLAYVRVGGTLSQRVLLGVESAGFYGSHLDTDLYRSNLSGVVLFYPGMRGGLFLKGGAGLSYVNTSISERTTIGGIDYYNSISEAKTGFGATAGWDSTSGWAGTCTWCRSSTGTCRRSATPTPRLASRPPSTSSPSPWDWCGTDRLRRGTPTAASRGGSPPPP